jgi:hypothetical protein
MENSFKHVTSPVSMVVRGAEFPDLGFDGEAIGSRVLVTGFEAGEHLDPLSVAPSEFQGTGLEPIAVLHEDDLPVTERLDGFGRDRERNRGRVADETDRDEGRHRAPGLGSTIRAIAVLLSSPTSAPR